MLLSRALNRGYGMSRYRWPMHFALLNNDCLWVMDETQLMGVGVETSAQLDGLRNAWQTMASCPTWWMSATLEEARLTTVDHPTEGLPRLELSETERASGRPKELFEAPKAVTQCPLELSATTKASYAKDLAVLIRDRHRPGTFTLVVLNRVSRAHEVYEALAGGKEPGCDPSRVVALVHSRFRRPDRQRHESPLFGDGDDLGWTGEPKHLPTPHARDTGATEAYDDERDTFAGSWQSIEQHTQRVVCETAALADQFASDVISRAVLSTAALWHDVGKAHEVFQAMLIDGDASRAGTL